MAEILNIIKVIILMSTIGCYVEVVFGWVYNLITRTNKPWYGRLIGSHSFWMNIIYTVLMTGFYYLYNLLFSIISWWGLFVALAIGAIIPLIEAGIGLAGDKIFNYSPFPKRENGILGGYTAWWAFPVFVAFSIAFYVVIGLING